MAETRKMAVILAGDAAGFTGGLVEADEDRATNGERYRRRTPTKLEGRTGADTQSRLKPPDQENPMGRPAATLKYPLPTESRPYTAPELRVNGLSM